MLHLPGLVLAEQINPIIQSVNKLGLAVRGLYGEGTEALGNVFQVSNQMTLGESESDIVERLDKVLPQIIEHEENARATLLEKKPKMVYNHIGRAYGILANAHSISSKETMNLLSLMRLGVDLELFGIGAVGGGRVIHFDATRPPPTNFSGETWAEERDLLRADMLRERLRDMTARHPSLPVGVRPPKRRLPVNGPGHKPELPTGLRAGCEWKLEQFYGSRHWVFFRISGFLTSDVEILASKMFADLGDFW